MIRTIAALLLAVVLAAGSLAEREADVLTLTATEAFTGGKPTATEQAANRPHARQKIYTTGDGIAVTVEKGSRI